MSNNPEDITNTTNSLTSELNELTLGILQSLTAQDEGQASPTVLVGRPDQELTDNAPPEEDEREQQWVQPTGDDLRARLAIITNNIQ